MKKILYAVLMLFTATALVTSCNDDDDSQRYSQTSAADAEGTYVGELSFSYTDPTSGNEVSGTESATLVVTMKENYVVNVELITSSDSKSAVANISTSSAGYPFANKSTDSSNGFNTTFAGLVDNDGIATINYTLESRVGRKQVLADYEFVGKKQ